MTANNIMSEEALAQQFMQLPTSFDEILPEPIKIAWVEFVNYTETTEDGREVRKRKPLKRVSEINTLVPVRVLHKMMASQEKIKRIQTMRLKNADQIDGQMQQEMIDWMSNQVLNVWQLTEPDMTLELLQEGVGFQKIFSLFNLFFANQLAGLNKQS
jgi:hypothetical protein